MCRYILSPHVHLRHVSYGIIDGLEVNRWRAEDDVDCWTSEVVDTLVHQSCTLSVAQVHFPIAGYESTGIRLLTHDDGFKAAKVPKLLSFSVSDLVAGRVVAPSIFAAR